MFRVLSLFVAVCSAVLPVAAADAPSFTLEQVRSYPFPNELTAADTGSRIAWAVDDRGQRNIWVAEGPAFEPRKLTKFDIDDGQELTAVTLSPKGDYVVFVRGGDYGSNWDRAVAVNTLSLPTPPKVQLWSAPFSGGEPRVLADDADSPAISPKGDVVAFIKGNQAWVAKLDGSAPAQPMIATRGATGSLTWSPDGSKLAFVSSRDDHSFIGIYTSATTPIVWIEPSTTRDSSPRWSPDGNSLAFIRRPGAGTEPAIKKVAQPDMTIRVADVATGTSKEAWRAPAASRRGYPTNASNLMFAAGDRLVFQSFADGWQHLYSVKTTGGEPQLLTPGNFMVEHLRLSPDGKFVLCSGNTGPDSLDIDRRHLLKVPVDKAEPTVLTPGTGNEWSPAMTGDGKSIVCLSGTGQRPPMPTVLPAEGGSPKVIGQSLLINFPTSHLVDPKQVIFKSPDGLEIHGQLFEGAPSNAKKPAVVYIHGGPQRQMLLGWHYSSYYSNAYALNQYLASRGYVVLSVNYRLGIGYGHKFQFPGKTGGSGAAEYADIKAAGEYLKSLPQVDPSCIGVYGGSYGGYLTALALGRDCNLLTAGVDVHGVHKQRGSKENADPNEKDAGAIAWRSSPVSAIGTWKSPVLLISGDDDRNVAVSQTIDLAGRLAAAGVPFEQIIIPDDTHHFMRFANWMRVNAATAEFFDRQIGSPDAGRDPEVTAKAWAIVDGDNGKLLYGQAADERRKSASTTKVMCASVILQLAKKDPKVLDEIVTFSKLADDTPGSTAAINAGESLPVRDCLYGLLLPSGNDAGNALAEHFNSRFDPPDEAMIRELNLDVDGLKTRINFIAEMNRTARRWALTQTQYRSSYGDGGTEAMRTTTAEELARMAWNALQIEGLNTYVSTKTYTCKVNKPTGETRDATWENTNQLLGRFGIDGVKTGTTNQAGACLITHPEVAGKRFVVVVLGSTRGEDRFSDTSTLIRWLKGKLASH